MTQADIDGLVELVQELEEMELPPIGWIMPQKEEYLIYIQSYFEKLKYYTEKIDDSKIQFKLNDLQTYIGSIEELHRIYAELKPVFDDLKEYLKSSKADTPNNYYSQRTNGLKFDDRSFHQQVTNIYHYFKNQDYFNEKLGISAQGEIPSQTKIKCHISLGFKGFDFFIHPIQPDRMQLFDMIEYFYYHISRPGPLENMTSDTGYNYTDYIYYSTPDGRKEFRAMINTILNSYDEGFELTEKGEIEHTGSNDIELLLDAEIPEYDVENVDNRVRDAIKKWKNKELDRSKRKEAIKDLADVFEWLKDTKELKNALNKNDASDLFNIANNFSIRHHNTSQKGGYDEDIWYSWMFHFYLATYHAAIRTIKRKNS